MDIFIKNKNKFSEYKYNPSDKESEIESFLEKNPHILEKNLEIIGSQVKIKPNGQRVDLLGLDSENNLVVIEIKKTRAKYSAIGQGHHYHMWASDIKFDDFVYLMNKLKLKIPHRLRTKNMNKKPIKFNYDPRLYVVAEYIDEDAINDAKILVKKDVNMECVEIKFYDNKIVTMDKKLSKPSTRSNDMIMNCDKSILDLFDRLRKWIIESFDDSNEVSTENYFAYKCNIQNFITLHVLKHKIKAHFVTYDLNDPKKLTKQHDPKKFHGRIWEMMIDESNIPDFKNFARQAHKNICS